MMHKRRNSRKHVRLEEICERRGQLTLQASAKGVGILDTLREEQDSGYLYRNKLDIGHTGTTRALIVKSTILWDGCLVVNHTFRHEAISKDMEVNFALYMLNVQPQESLWLPTGAGLEFTATLHRKRPQDQIRENTTKSDYRKRREWIYLK